MHAENEIAPKTEEFVGILIVECTNSQHCRSYNVYQAIRLEIIENFRKRFYHRNL